jgi:hypothetical protein
MFTLSENKDCCMQNIALHAFLIGDRLHIEMNHAGMLMQLAIFSAFEIVVSIIPG